MKRQSKTATNGRTELLDCLWSYQKAKGYISDVDVNECSRKLGMSKVGIEGVLSFYHFFSRKPRGSYTVYLNNAIISELKGYRRIREAFEKETGSTFNEEDGADQFGLFDTPCIGLSDQEPAALINFHPFTNLNSLKVRDIVSKLRKGVPVEELCDDVPDNIRRIPGDDRAIFFREYYPGIALEQLKGQSPDEVIDQVIKSDLRGMGGAFFPTGLKWKFCRKEKDSPKYVVCNADEGEPGTFKDRVLLNSTPGLVIEGMAISAYAIGAEEGLIYLRAEYMWLLPKLNKTLEQFRRMGLLGKDVGGIEGFNFDIRIQIGAGSYVCGEETALLNSLEGKRGEPRTKLFFPTEKGFLGKPTVVNNVETLCAAARVIQLGVEKFRKSGTLASPGTKLISVSGDCHAPGVYEIEWGTTVGQLLEWAKADDPYFIQVSGPSGECISMDEINRKLSLDDLKCGGSFMIFNSNRNILKILTNFADFFKHESCGVCTPCRAGNFIIRNRLQKMELGMAGEDDLQEIRGWGEIMRKTSRCGLGKTATKSLCIALDKFSKDLVSKGTPEEIQFNRSFDLEEAVRDYEQFKT